MAFDAFMQFKTPDITGESTATGFTGAFEVYSFSWGASNPVTIGSGSTGVSGGKVSISSFNVMKKSENASAVLFSACCTGQHYAQVIVTLRKATGTSGGQKPYLVYTFTDCMIESIQWSGSSGGDDTPTESLSIAFGQVSIAYSQQTASTGAVTKASTASWDLTKVSV